MGLPLFHAPVESDIPSKPALKNPADPATTRSPIRRAERRRQLLETRTHRLQLLHALQSNSSDTNDATLSERLPSEPRSRPPEMARTNSSDPRRYDLWNNIDTNGDDETFAWVYPGAPEVRQTGRADTSQPATLPGPEALIAGESFGGVDYSRPIGLEDFDPRLMAEYRRITGQESSAPRRSRDPPYVAGRLRPPITHRSSSHESAGASRSSRARNPDPGEYLNEYHRRRAPQDPASRPRRRRLGRYVRYMDGLGDRERSPEDDSAWDTLQQSITPDPQPPSVGSSFASTTVSAAASQTTADSSNTSVTNPDEEALEPPCDPVDQNLGSDGEDIRGAVVLRTEPSRRPTPHGRRRSDAGMIADLLPPVDNDESDSLEWLSEVQRIVQGLASRDDIPDRWWAAVGLTRSMTSE